MNTGKGRHHFNLRKLGSARKICKKNGRRKIGGKKIRRRGWLSFCVSPGGRGGARVVHAVVGVLCFFLRRLEDLEGTHQSLVDRHHAARVVELAAVVGCREKGDQLPLGEKLVPIFDHLVRATD